MKKLLLIFTFMVSLLFMSSCSVISVYSDWFISLGTVIDIEIYNEDNASKYMSDLKSIYSKITKSSSAYETYADPTISVYALNKNRTISLTDSNANEDYFNCLKELLEYSLEIKEETNGYFNPFIGKLTTLWKKPINAALSSKSYEEVKSLIPSSDDINLLLEEMNNTTLTITDDTISINGDGNIDLGAIAKGYATKKAHEYLDSVNCNSYFINSGTSNIVFSNKAGNNFNVELSDVNPTMNNANIIGSILGVDISITTSSMGSQSFYLDDIYYHHIISPIDGYPKSYYTTVNIFNYDEMYSDAYGTAIFSMDYDTAVSFINDNELEATLYSSINNSGFIYKSDNLGDYFNET